MKKKGSFFKYFVVFLCFTFVFSGISSLTAQSNVQSESSIDKNNIVPDAIVLENRVLRF